MPVLAGSGVKAENAKEQFSILDGAIVGSFIKKDGKYANPVDEARVRCLMDAVHAS
ncbi:MAG: BtpA/SgcQ family protein [Christensenella sp.]